MSKAPVGRKVLRLRVILAVAVAVIAVSALPLATVSVEPLRGRLWNAVGHSCGTVLVSARQCSST
jgi:hypothetical protein